MDLMFNVGCHSKCQDVNPHINKNYCQRSGYGKERKINMKSS